LIGDDLSFLPSIKLAAGKVQGAGDDPRLFFREVGTNQFGTLIAKLIRDLLPVGAVDDESGRVHPQATVVISAYQCHNCCQQKIQLRSCEHPGPRQFPDRHDLTLPPQ
jgi:hypothetical protein